MPTSEIWSRILTSLREELPDRTVTNWFESADLERHEDSNPPQLLLRVPNSFHRDYIHDRHYSSLLSASQDVVGQGVKVQIQIGDDLEDDGEEPAGRTAGTRQDDRSKERVRRAGGDGRQAGATVSSRKQSPQEMGSAPTIGRGARSTTQSRSVGRDDADDSVSEFHCTRIPKSLKDRYTFDNFVVGDSNELARSASSAVAKNPGGTGFNPLLIYGGVGLGKTHLAQAIANYAATEQTAEFVCYVSGEKFTNEFVNAIRKGNGEQFSRKYREVDLLILDDVQFFQGKEKTQEEFFHLFNALHQQNKQIVLCADRPPQKIEGLEERLISRFEWGLSADVQRPDFEMRLAILQLKAEALSLDIDEDVLDCVAKSITSNIRQLEGALKQLAARASLLETGIDVPTARKILNEQMDLQEPKTPNPDHILNAVTAFYSVSREDMVGRSRRQELVHARHVAMYFFRKMTSHSLAAIGLRFAGRDHSTVSHACQKIQDRLDVEPHLEEELKDVKRTIQEYAARG